MLRNVKMVISLLFRWGEHAIFAAHIAKFFGLQKMVISMEAGLLASLAEWPDQPRPFWVVMAGLVGFAVALVILNVIFGLFIKWKISKAMTSSAPATGIGDAFPNITLALQAEADKERAK